MSIVTAATGIILTLGTAAGTYIAIADGADDLQTSVLKQDAQTVGEALRLDAVATEDPSGLTCAVQPGGVIELEMSRVELRGADKQAKCWSSQETGGETHIIVDTSSTDPSLAGYVARWDSETGTTLYKNGSVVPDDAPTIEAQSAR